jgi:hypothetical protein
MMMEDSRMNGENGGERGGKGKAMGGIENLCVS